MALGDTQRLILKLEAKGIKLTKHQLKQLDGQVKTSTGIMKKFGGKAGVIAAVTASLLLLKKALEGIVNTGKSFEQAMQNLKAITGATNIQLMELENTARRLGLTTRFTATEVGNLQTEYARLGFSVEEIDNATESTLALAASVNADLAQAALIAGQTVRAFQMDASETGRVTDVMAKSFTSSALTMDKFSDSMTYIGPVAKSAGFDIEGTSAALAVVTNAGISGSIAGTSLRRIFTELSNESSKLTKRLGGPIKNATDLSIALKKLNKEGVTTAEVKDLVGLRATSAFQIMLAGADDINSLNEAFKAANGAAAEMAEIQLDSLEGKMIILNSAAQGLGIAIYDYFNEPLKDLTDTLTGVVQNMAQIVEIPWEEKMNTQRSSMNALFSALERTNIPLELRQSYIKTLNTEYKEYLPYLIDEKTSNQDIAKAKKEANDEFVRGILLQSNEAKLKDIVRDNKDEFDDWGLSIIKTEEAQNNLDDAVQKQFKTLNDYNKAMGTNLTLEEFRESINNKLIKSQKGLSESLGDTESRMRSVSGAGNDYINSNEELRDSDVKRSNSVEEATKKLSKYEQGFLFTEDAINKYQNELKKAEEVEAKSEKRVEKVNQKLKAQQKIFDKLTEKLGETKDEIDDIIEKEDKPTFWENVIGRLSELNFKKDFDELKTHVAEVTAFLEETFQEEIDKETEYAEKRMDEIDRAEDHELDRLRATRAYQSMSDKQRLQAEKDVMKKHEKLRDQQRSESNNDIRDAFYVQQIAKLGSVAMETADAVMKAVAASPLTFGQPWKSVAIGMGVTQAGIILAQKPPVLEQGGLIGGNLHAQGGTLIEAERGEFILNRKAVESIGIDTLNQMNNQGSSPVNITFQGNILSKDFIEDEAIPQIKEAIRRGADIGIG